MLKKLAQEAAGQGIEYLWLEASKAGRPVDERFGFRDTQTWMEMILEEQTLDH